MAYVYRHIRLDKNVPFYIGIGADNNYRRARLRHGRSALWNNIVAKTKYEVEIIIDDITWEEACVKEKEFISLYGRRNTKAGTLVNLTDGGEGNFGQVVSKKTKERLSKIFSKEVAQYDLNGHFIKTYPSAVEAAKQLGKKSSTPISCCITRKNCFTAYKFVWRLYNGNKDDINFNEVQYNSTVFGRKRINAFDKNGDFLATFNSFMEAARILKIQDSSVCNIVNGKRKATRNGIRFKLYSNDFSNIGVHTNPDQKGKNGHFFGKVGGNKGKLGKDHPASKSVNQIDIKTGNIINTFHSCREAALSVFGNKLRSSITACCKGKLQTSGGFKWEYKK